MVSSEQLYREIVSFATLMFPKFKVRYKTDSRLMRILGLLVRPFCPDFMSSYVTTWGYSVYFPSEKFVADNYTAAWKILCHELVHLVDYRKDRIGFTVRYALPQGLAILVFGALLTFIWPLASFFLLALLALGPWPSSGRMSLEMRAYTMTLAINYWRYGSISDVTKSWLVDKVLLGWGYYRMCGSRELAKRAVAQAEKEIVDGVLIKGYGAVSGYESPFPEIYDLLKRLGVAQ